MRSSRDQRNQTYFGHSLIRSRTVATSDGFSSALCQVSRFDSMVGLPDATAIFRCASKTRSIIATTKRLPERSLLGMCGRNLASIRALNSALSSSLSRTEKRGEEFMWSNVENHRTQASAACRRSGELECYASAFAGPGVVGRKYAANANAADRRQAAKSSTIRATSMNARESVSPDKTAENS